MTGITNRFLHGIHSNYVELIDEPVYLAFGVNHTNVEVTEFAGTEEDESPFVSIHLRSYNPLSAGESAMELFDMNHGDTLETATVIQHRKGIYFDDMGCIIYLDDIDIFSGHMITSCRQAGATGGFSATAYRSGGDANDDY